MQDSKILRWADRNVGAAICAAISGLRPRKSRPKPLPAKPKILLIELFEMGATVMLLPTLRRLRQESPEAEIHILTSTTCASIWKLLQDTHRAQLHVIDGSSSLRFVFSFLATAWKLRRWRFDLILDYELFMRIPAIMVGLLRGERRAGFHRYQFEGLYRGSFYTHPCTYNQNTHIAKNYLALTEAALADRIEVPHPKLSLSNASVEIERVIPKPSAQVLAKWFGPEPKPYIVLCPDVGPNLAMRNWPRESFAELMRSLLQSYPHHDLALVGTAQDLPCVEDILGRVGPDARVKNLCGKTSFTELIQVIAGAELLVTNDNGPAHFAVLSHTPTLALFSTDSPFVYGPLGKAVIAYSFFHCSPCISALNHKVSHCRNNLCLQTISPAQVFGLAREILEGRAKYRTINNEWPYLLERGATV